MPNLEAYSRDLQNNIKFTHDKLSQLKNAFNQQKETTQLRIANDMLSEEDILYLATKLTHITHFIFITPLGFNAAQALVRNPRIKHLHLTTVVCTSKQKTELEVNAKENPTLTVFKIGTTDNNPANITAFYVTDAMKSTKLTLAALPEGIRYSRENMRTLTSFLYTDSIKEVNLANCQLTEDALLPFVSSLLESSVVKLNLSGIDINSQDVIDILARNTRLRELNLFKNPRLTPEHLRPFLQNNTLCHLFLPCDYPELRAHIEICYYFSKLLSIRNSLSLDACNPYAEKDLRLLLDKLNDIQSIQELVLSNGISDVVFNALFSSLPSQVITLSLATSLLTTNPQQPEKLQNSEQHTTKIAALLKAHPQVQRVNVQNLNVIGEASLVSFIEQLPDTVTSFSVSGNNPPLSVDALRVLVNKASIRVLHIGYEITCFNIGELQSILLENETLLAVSFYHSNVPTDIQTHLDFNNFIHRFKQNPSQILDMSNKTISNRQLKRLMKLLQECPHVTTVNFSRCQLTDEQLTIVANGLPKTVVSLNVADNDIHSVNGLGNATHLIELNASKNPLGLQGIREIATQLQTPKVNLSGIQLGYDAIMALLKNSKLTSLTLNIGQLFKQLDKEQKQAVLSAIANSHLTSLIVADSALSQYPGLQARINETLPKLVGKINRFFEFCTAGNTSAVQQLLKQSYVSPYIQGQKDAGMYHSFTALHIAVKNKRSDLVRYLVEEFPTLLNIRSNQGTPLQLAKSLGLREMEELLFQLTKNLELQPQEAEQLSHQPLQSQCSFFARAISSYPIACENVTMPNNDSAIISSELHLKKS